MAEILILTDSEKTTPERILAVIESLGAMPENVALVCLKGLSEVGVAGLDSIHAFEPPLSQWEDADLINCINDDVRPKKVVLIIEAEELRPAANHLLPFSYFIRSMEQCFWVDEAGLHHDISEPVTARMGHTRDWTKSDEGFLVREYENYEDYIKVQCSKYKKEEEKIKADTERLLYPVFKQRFEAVEALLPERASVICIGARSGWEVKAYHDLGHNAIGIDLYPGKDNPYVVYGDAHDIHWPDGVFDLVYCNVIDHLPYIDKFLAETKRISREDGLCFFEFGRERQAEECEALAWENSDDFIEYLKGNLGEIHVLRDKFGFVQMVAKVHQ